MQPWAAYVLTVEDDRIVKVEPFEGDPVPSSIIHSVLDWATSDLRIRRPMVRRGWYRARMEGRTPDGAGRGEDRFDVLPLG